MRHCLYRLTFPGGKSYIGVTANMRRRLTGHKTGNTAKLTKRAWAKYGAPEVSVLVTGSREYIYGMEQAAIEVFNTHAPAGYNLAEGGRGGAILPVPEERKRRISESMKAAHARGDIKRTYTPTEDHRQNLSKAHKGRVKSAEERANIAKGLLGRKFSDEHRANISAALTGLKRSEETRRRMSEAQQARRNQEKAAK